MRKLPQGLHLMGGSPGGEVSRRAPPNLSALRKCGALIDERTLWGCRNDLPKVYLVFGTPGTASRGLCRGVFDGRGYRGNPTSPSNRSRILQKCCGGWYCYGNAPSRGTSVGAVASEREIGVGMISKVRRASKVRCAD
ncbi:hypothetical protein AXF42_Ash021355 [Apostasia shenzhenica]|uniref:Uncharacterized protein n=1 Tax=Apostasia shenzhenica TaxID=1088818 RepID=A0A2H9ZSQ9_9ASPA|nr:hypothetical protein AXF42_Ash021355 [Apostasia shenzhenica]